MTIDEAIKEGKTILAVSSNVITVKQQKAIKLGIEALKYIKEHRIDWHCDYPLKLPGETKD